MIDMFSRGNVMSILIGCAFLLALTSCSQLADHEISKEELMEHISYLASEEVAGRYPGTAGDSLAAAYIRENFKRNGLILQGDGGYQPLSVTTEVELGDSNSFFWNRRNLLIEKDFIPLSFSANGHIRGEILFAGYGISIDNEEFAYDDYLGLDVTGKIVLVLEGAPPFEAPDSDPFAGFLTQRYKILNAMDRGAVAVVFVAGETFDPGDVLQFRARKEPPVGLPSVRITREAANELFQAKGLEIKDLEIFNWKEKYGEIRIQQSVLVQTDLLSKKRNTQNVLGMLRGKSYPNDSIIIVGAHYDHLGWGGKGSGSRVPDTLAVHYGADDNASGVAALIELAGKLNESRNELNHSFLFIAFAAEEMGLIGSKYFVEHPLIPFDRVKAMVNLDMLGRLKDEKSLSIGGVGTAAEFSELILSVNDSIFQLALSQEGYGPSDHASFYGMDKPVLFISTGAHIDYHTPNDNIAGINAEGLLEVSGFLYHLLRQLDGKEQLSYREAGPKQQASARSQFKVTMGLMPDVTGSSENGLKVEFVTEGRPAQRSGMQKGDIIVAMNGLPVTNVYDYMTRLQTLEAGQTVTVEVVRGDKRIVLLVQL